MSGCRCNETREKKRCAQENIEIINELRISDTNPNSVVEKDLSPNVSTRLYETRELKEVEELLKSSGGISQINVQDVKPLQLAVAQGTSFELVKWLIEHGSDVNMCFGFRRTPFHLALKRGKNAVEEVCSILLLFLANLCAYRDEYFSTSNRMPFYRRKWINRTNIVLIKSLIRLTLLYGYSKSYVNEIKIVLLNEKCSGHEIGRFTRTCIYEVQRLRREKIGRNMVLYDIVTSEPEELPLGPVKPHIHFPLNYKIYHDIIERRVNRYMRRIVLFRVLRDTNMIIVSESSNKQICVVSDCLVMICEYLVNNDVNNFLKALFDEHTLYQRLESLDI